jgi:hypothetical protein
METPLRHALTCRHGGTDRAEQSSVRGKALTLYIRPPPADGYTLTGLALDFLDTGPYAQIAPMAGIRIPLPGEIRIQEKGEGNGIAGIFSSLRPLNLLAALPATWRRA